MAYELQDSLHRLIKQAMDSGQASNLEEAEALFHGYRIHFSIGEAQSNNVVDQAALLTGVALGRRVFLGGVTVDGPLDSRLLVPLPLGSTLRDAVRALGGITDTQVRPGVPTVFVGGGARERCESFAIRTTYAGWRGGAVPAHSPLVLDGSGASALTGMLTSALAVNEAFLCVAGTTRAAGRRAVGLSLWNPSASVRWLEADASEPTLKYLPSDIWVIGLGHLGQAYLWALGLLPYSEEASLNLMLQDVDVITPSSESTCILSDRSMAGRRKTRVITEWAELRGFKTSICERLFDSSFRRQKSEAPVALCGIDNALGRRSLDQAGFDLVVEAGLGRSHRDYSSIRLHTLPGPRAAAEIWNDSARPEDTANQAAYQELLDKGKLEKCGVTQLAGKAVGAPFVGAAAACLAVAELLRVLHEGPIHSVLEMDLQSVEHRICVRRSGEQGGFNPGFVRVA